MRVLSTHAATAKAIRQELKRLFPKTTFAVKSRSFSGGDACDVEWTDGPTYNEVQKHINKYQFGNFDGMQDLYEYSNVIEGLPQVKYVQVRRNVSQSILDELFRQMQGRYDGWDKMRDINDYSTEFMQKWRFWTPREYIMFNCIADKDLTDGYPSLAYA